MIQVKFKNLEKSEFAKETATERVEAMVNKFPDLRGSRIIMTLEMENSPAQAGPDLFKVKVHIGSGRYRGTTLEKSSPNLYVALAEVVDHMLEKLNRFGDRLRIKERTRARRVLDRASELKFMEDS